MQALHSFEGAICVHKPYFLSFPIFVLLLKLITPGHIGRIFSVALCTLPDGRKVAASASHDRTVRIWCLDGLQHIRTIEYTDFVWRVFIVLCYNRPCVVAFISTEDKIQVSNLDTGETINTFYGRLVFSGHTSLFHQPIIITSQGEEDIAFLDVNDGQVLFTIHGGFEKVFRAVVSQGVRPHVVFTTWNAPNRRSTIQTYDLIENTDIHNVSNNVYKHVKSSDSISAEREKNRQKMHLVFEGDSRDGVTSLVITLNINPMICSGHYDFKVRLWSMETKELIRVLEGHTDYVGSVAAWKGNDPYVISGSSDGTIKVWDTQNGAMIVSCEGHLRDVWAVTVTQSPHPLVVSASFDRSVRVWDLNPTIAQLRWNRRKSFCLFIYCLLKTEELKDETKKLNNNNISVSYIDEIIRAKLTLSHDLRTDYYNRNDKGYLDMETVKDENDDYCSLIFSYQKEYILQVFQMNSLCRQIASYL
eukprot:gene8179-11065_t